MTAKFAFVFPGQGSQSVGMLSDLSASSPLVRQTFDEASEIVGLDLWSLSTEGPAAVLDRTEHTQPAMLAAGVAVWRVWLDRGGPAPSAMAGHSLGEYTALVCAGSLSFPDAVSLVLDRGRLMQEAVPEGEGAMAAVLGLDDDQVCEACREAAGDEVVEAVNFNSPGQVVIAGHRGAVERAGIRAKAAGARRILPLPVSVPSHCTLMETAAGELGERLAEIDVFAPAIPVLHNANCRSTSDPDEIRTLLIRQLYNPVRWRETIEAMASAGVTHLLEGGPGRVLTGLAKRIDRNLTGLPVHDTPSLDAALEAVNEA
ncbi:MAG: ACP S-malonyltransferase [Chromatiales bacterium]|jgi:[acyl-carrier-protein] S-malonyltransferase